MPSKNPLGKIKGVADVAVSTVVTTAVGTATSAIGAVGAVASKVPVPGRSKPSPRSESTAPTVVAQESEAKAHGDPVTPSKRTPAKQAPAKKAASKKAPVKKAAAKKTAAKKTAGKKLASPGKLEIPTPDETALADKAAGSSDQSQD